MIIKGGFRNPAASKKGLLETIVNRQWLPTINYSWKELS